jgi:hypothetical protein
MTATIDIPRVRAALVPATHRDLRRHRARRRRMRLGAAVALAVLAATTGVAAATGLLFAPPKPDPAVPAVAEWTYYSQNPYGHGGGPVLLREHPAALARDNRAAEAALADAGVTARCGTDPHHPLACFLRNGDPVPADQMGPVLSIAAADGPADFDVKPLTPAQARAWLCTHPAQRPGADGGEKVTVDEGC